MEIITAYLNRCINSVLGRGLLDNVVVDTITVPEYVAQRLNTDGLILEAKTLFNPVPGVKHYTYRIDPQLGEGGPGRQRHIHMFYNGEELFSMNTDATAHDGYHQVKIPDALNPFLKSKGFSLPSNNIIEMLQASSGSRFICESLDYRALNRFVLNVGEVIRHASIITIIEANVETYQVKAHSKVRCVYQHVNQLDDVPQENLTEIKEMLISLLRETGKYSGDRIEIFDSYINKPHKLFVAWS